MIPRETAQKNVERVLRRSGVDEGSIKAGMQDVHGFPDQ